MRKVVIVIAAVAALAAAGATAVGALGTDEAVLRRPTHAPFDVDAEGNVNPASVPEQVRVLDADGNVVEVLTGAEALRRQRAGVPMGAVPDIETHEE